MDTSHVAVDGEQLLLLVGLGVLLLAVVVLVAYLTRATGRD
jgi:hypothetical protein